MRFFKNKNLHLFLRFAGYYSDTDPPGKLNVPKILLSL